MATARTPVVAAALVVSSVLLGGCAAKASPSLGGRLIRPGEPALELAETMPAAPGSRSTSDPRQRIRPTSSGALTVENTDARLTAALMLAEAQPTAGNYLRVVAEYQRLGVIDDAFEYLALAAAKAPRAADVHEATARVWRDEGQPSRALSSAHRAVFLSPASASAHNTLGTVFDALGQLDAARDAYMKALTLEPDGAWALNNLCYVEYRAARWEDARLACEAALRIDPALAAAHNNLALIHAATGDMTSARAAFLAAGDAATGYYNLGIAWLAAGDHRAAAEAFEEAIRLRPDFTAAKQRAHAARLRLLTGSN